METVDLARSYLYAPGDNTRFLDKLSSTAADAMVLDLEDSVLASRKDDARRMVSDWLGSASVHGRFVYVRINVLCSNIWKADVEAVVCPALKGIRVPKADSADELRALDAFISSVEKAKGMRAGAVSIVPIVESAAGLTAVPAMAKCPRVSGFAFGETDFANDIGAMVDCSGLQLLYTKSQLVVLSRAAGLHAPIASVFTDIHDLNGLRSYAITAKSLGFFGCSCIHPTQVAVINEIFTPTEAEVSKAQRLIEDFEIVSQGMRGAVAIADGQFVDEAVLVRARRIVQLAERVSMLNARGIH